MNAHAQVVEFREAKDPLVPAPPRRVCDLGIDEDFLVELLIKTLFRLELERASDLGRAMRIPASVVIDLMALAEREDLIERVLELGASVPAEPRYALTDGGRSRAIEAFRRSAYAGPVPVTLFEFSQQIARQSIRDDSPDLPALSRALEPLALAREMLSDLDAALSFKSSILLYGSGANGKSSIAHAICSAFMGTVYLPHAIVIDKQVIAVYDPTFHHPIDDTRTGNATHQPLGAAGQDLRYVACRRPAIITGSELTLDRLDPALNTISGIYEAPIQLKVAGGVLVIDDFGCQRQPPQELFNRLTVPLERGVDDLCLETGRRFQIPFDSLVVISTSYSPKKLLDDVMLRRLHYKLLVSKPDRETYAMIFRRAAKDAGLRVDKRTTDYVLDELYGKSDGVELAASHPHLLIERVQAISASESAQPQLRRNLLKRAWRSLFVVGEA